MQLSPFPRRDEWPPHGVRRRGGLRRYARAASHLLWREHKKPTTVERGRPGIGGYAGMARRWPALKANPLANRNLSERSRTSGPAAVQASAQLTRYRPARWTAASPSGRLAQIFDRYWTLSEVRRSVSGSTSAVIDQNAGVRENRPRAETRPWIMSP